MKAEILPGEALHSNQFAIQKGKSTVDALHAFNSRVKKAERSINVTISALLDIEDVFSDTTTENILNSTEERGVETTANRWMRSNLCDRIVQSSLAGCSVRAKVKMGCPQGGILSFNLWALFIQDLIRRLNQSCLYTQGYVDDICYAGNRLEHLR